MTDTEIKKFIADAEKRKSHFMAEGNKDRVDYWSERIDHAGLVLKVREVNRLNGLGE